MVPGSLTRRGARGAAFVEAIIIISSMTLMLLGMVFFRTFYLRQMRASRVARATVMAYSMGGCIDKPPPQGGPGGPSAWAGPDLDKSATPTGSVGQETRPAEQLKPSPKPADTDAARQGKDGSDKMLKNIPGAPVDGNALFPVAHMGLEMGASATTKQGVLQTERGFKSKVRSKSYVVCGEEMRPGNILDLIHFAQSFVKTSSQPPVLPPDYHEDPPTDLPPEYK
jgi:hypothetical protein